MQINAIQSSPSFEASPKVELLRMAKLQNELTNNQNTIRVQNKIINYDKKKIGTYAREHSSEEVLTLVEKIRTNMITALQKEKMMEQAELDRLCAKNKQALYLKRKELRDNAKSSSKELAYQITHPKEFTYPNASSIKAFVEEHKKQLASIYPRLQADVKELTISVHQARIKKLENLIEFVTNYRKPQEKIEIASVV